MIKTLAAQSGGLLNINELSNSLNLARRKTEEYIELLIETFVLIKLTPYSRNIRSQLTKMPKFYWFDPGIRNGILNNYSSLAVRADSGALFENFIFNELGRYKENKVFFYRTTNKSEIDFIIEKGGQIFPLEVKYKKLTRPINSRVMAEFCGETKSHQGKIINLNYNKAAPAVSYVDFRRFLADKIFTG